MKVSQKCLFLHFCLRFGTLYWHQWELIMPLTRMPGQVLARIWGGLLKLYNYRHEWEWVSLQQVSSPNCFCACIRRAVRIAHGDEMNTYQCSGELIALTGVWEDWIQQTEQPEATGGYHKVGNGLLQLDLLQVLQKTSNFDRPDWAHMMKLLCNSVGPFLMQHILKNCSCAVKDTCLVKVGPHYTDTVTN